MQNNQVYWHREEGEKIWWELGGDHIGEMIFSFDKKTKFNFWTDYPHKLTPEQKAIFDIERGALAELKG